MNKYKQYNIRPAGDSDDSDSDSDEFYFGSEDFRPKKRVINWNNRNNEDDDQPNVEDFSFIEQQAALEAKQNREFEVFKACVAGNKEAVENYIKDGNNVDEFLYTGWNLMLYATSSIQVEIVKLLLDFGADPNKHKDGYSPLMSLSNAIKTDIEDKAIECLHLLVNAKADANATNKNRENALILSTRYRSPQFVEELIKITHNLNLTDSEGNTALHYAALYDRFEIVKLLLEHKVEATIKNRHNLTAYDIAHVKEYYNIAAILSSGASNTFEICEDDNVETWQDLFPDMKSTHKDKILPDVGLILFGMGFERYKPLFKGMTLKTFLNLTEEDLKELGIDLSIHRQQFIENLQRLHNHRWNPRTFHFQPSKSSFKIFDGVLTLGNLVKKFCVIGSSYDYIRRCIKNMESNNLSFTVDQKKEYVFELDKTEKTVMKLKKELMLFKDTAKKIEYENRDKYPATYISPKKKYVNWTVIITVTTIAGLYLSKTNYVQRLLSINQ